MNELIITEDGSHSLYNIELNETYHSFHGALQESQHVFIHSGLDVHKSQEHIKVLEIGFGTGLNALLSAIWSEEHKIKLSYDSIEAFPLSMDLVNKLNYPDLIKHQDSKDWLKSIHHSDWEDSALIHALFHLKKINHPIQSYSLDQNTYDIVFFDAFAPSKQPEMWSLEILKKVTDSLIKGGLFVTYCAQGQLKRNLKTLGLEVETLPGPPGKKEMVRAEK